MKRTDIFLFYQIIQKMESLGLGFYANGKGCFADTFIGSFFAIHIKN